MEPTMIFSVAVLLALFVLLLLFIRQFTKKDGRPVVEIDNIAAAPPIRPRIPPNRGARNRMNQRLQGSDSEEENEEPSNLEVLKAEGKIGLKKMRKLQEKEEKKRQRELEIAGRQERKERDAQREEHRKKEEQRITAEEAAKELEEKKRKEEQEKREHEEYLKLKESFVVEEEGQDKVEEDSTSLLQEFINYIKDSKVVVLEDLAAHFSLKTQDVIDRVRTLVEEGQLSGVLDDRGKFIYITQEEYESVARFIRQRGRVSITELAECSNRLINLNPVLKAS